MFPPHSCLFPPPSFLFLRARTQLAAHSGSVSPFVSILEQFCSWNHLLLLMLTFYPTWCERLLVGG